MGTWDRKEAARGLGLPESVFDELLKSFVSDAENDLSSLDAAFSANDLDEVARIGHGIKGMAGNLSITHIQCTAKAIETIAKSTKSASEISVKLDELKRDISELKQSL